MQQFPNDFSAKVNALAATAPQTEAPSGPRQCGLVFYLLIFIDKLALVLINLLCLAPLYAIYQFRGEPLAWLAVLCPVLYLLVVLPLRYSFADAIVQPSEADRHFCLCRALSLRNYGAKLKYSVLNLLRDLLWGIPMFAVLEGCAYWVYYNYYTTNVLSMLGTLQKVGTFKYTVINWFLKLLGQSEMTVPSNTLMDCFVVLGAALGFCLLIWAFGTARNNGYRYVWAWSKKQGISFHDGYRRQIRKRRWKHFLISLLNFVFWIPFLAVIYVTVKPVVNDLTANLLTYLLDKSLPVEQILTSLKPLLYAYLFLYLLILPARNWVNARFFSSYGRHETDLSMVYGK